MGAAKLNFDSNVSSLRETFLVFMTFHTELSNVLHAFHDVVNLVWKKRTSRKSMKKLSSNFFKSFELTTYFQLTIYFLYIITSYYYILSYVRFFYFYSVLFSNRVSRDIFNTKPESWATSWSFWRVQSTSHGSIINVCCTWSPDRFRNNDWIGRNPTLGILSQKKRKQLHFKRFLWSLWLYAMLSFNTQVT